MSTQPTPTSQTEREELDGPLGMRVNEMSQEYDLEFPIPLFECPSYSPETGWLIVDLVACAASPLGHSVTRTFQARELINNDISVGLPELRTQSFFTEVQKLLIFTENMGLYESVWNDEVLNKRAVDVQNAEILVLMDDATIWDGKQILEAGKVIELFERATDMGLEKLTFYVEWYNSSLSQDISLAREQFRQEARRTASRKRLRTKSLVHMSTSAASELLRRGEHAISNLFGRSNLMISSKGPLEGDRPRPLEKQTTQSSS
ncbi:hypothetical protein INS49_006236 [Diaporthe citri]|uniref:uncharacterized protein n=1 Tax=Diaporthe citri TaxID=83186 RepID=UPI001C802E33|nr:uncharacterized protein INS49_006236 [Diaporthe citri]KAG6364633.1 hypothetical protein INS49_006236 [Diaporthe citri]